MSETIIAKNFPLGTCFNFMYLISGPKSDSKINVYKKLTSNDAKIILFSTKADQQSNKIWKPAFITLDGTKDNFELYLEVEIGI